MIPFLPQLSRVSTICFESRAHEEMYTFHIDDNNAAIKVSSSYERFKNVALSSLTSLEHVSLILAGFNVPWVQTLDMFKVWHMKTAELRFREDLNGQDAFDNLQSEGITAGPFQLQRFTLDVPVTFRPEQWASLLNLCAPLFPHLRQLHFRSSRPYPISDVSSFLVRILFPYHLRY